MHLKVKVLDDEMKSLYEERLNHDGDSGFDLYMPDSICIDNGDYGMKVPLGVQVVGYNDNGDNVGYWMIPRSSISKTPFRLANSLGLIDAGYRGELLAVIDNVAPAHLHDVEYVEHSHIDAGSRLFQIVAFDGSPITFELVDELDETSRGEGGFGSTGK